MNTSSLHLIWLWFINQQKIKLCLIFQKMSWNLISFHMQMVVHSLLVRIPLTVLVSGAHSFQSPTYINLTKVHFFPLPQLLIFKDPSSHSTCYLNHINIATSRDNFILCLITVLIYVHSRCLTCISARYISLEMHL